MCDAEPKDHSKWAVTIPDSSEAVLTSRKLLQNATLASTSEDLSKVPSPNNPLLAAPSCTHHIA